MVQKKEGVHWMSNSLFNFHNPLQILQTAVRLDKTQIGNQVWNWYWTSKFLTYLSSQIPLNPWNKVKVQIPRFNFSMCNGIGLRLSSKIMRPGCQESESCGSRLLIKSFWIQIQKSTLYPSSNIVDSYWNTLNRTQEYICWKINEVECKIQKAIWNHTSASNSILSEYWKEVPAIWAFSDSNLIINGLLTPRADVTLTFLLKCLTSQWLAFFYIARILLNDWKTQ